MSLESEVLEISKAKFKMMTDADVAALDQLLDSNFTLTHITGHVGSRAEWLGDIQSGTFNYREIVPEDFQVKVAGTKALVVSKARHEVTLWGGQGTYNLELTESYEKRGAEWTLLSLIAKIY